MKILKYEQPPQQYQSTPPPTPEQSVRVEIDNPAKKPLVTYAILGVTVAIFLLQLFTQNTMGIDLPAIYLAKYNQLILSGEIWRLISPVLVHGSFAHIAFNMYALFIFGRNLEYQYGHGRFLLLYLLGGFAGNVVSFVLTPNPSLGASTAIFGMLAAQGVFIYRNRRFFGNRARPILSNIIFILGINLVLGLSPMIDNWGHLGGLIGGLVFAWTAGPLWEMRADLQGYRLVDQQETWQMILGALIVIVAFGALAIVRWF
ncbi:MAG TPA: rhomboid family intramembrane serine protease [Anaerolineaceae bacterium]|nr:rhomboid family intramembrane serine protease [Anaerolineaceae bacterium]